MNLLATIRDKDFGLDNPAPQSYEERTAARAVVFDSDMNIALLHSLVKQYHKLPGGGVNAGEEIVKAMQREAVEEIGCHIEPQAELGTIEEFRNVSPLHQISHCYIARCIGEKGEPHLEEGEIAEGFVTEWMPLEKAIETLEGELGVEHYEAKFMTTRDLTFLKEAQKNV